MQHLDEGTIHAWLDGELSADEAEKIAAHANECAECGALVAEARGLIAASTRILTALDNVPAGVMPSGSAMPEKPAIAGGAAFRRHWYDRTDLRAAAAVLFVAGASLVAVRVARNPTQSMKAVATTANSAVADVAPLLQDSAAPAEAEIAQQEKRSEVKPLSEAPSAFAEPRRERQVAASPPAMASKASKVTAREPVAAPAPAMANAMDAVSPSKAMSKVRSDAPVADRMQRQVTERAAQKGATALDEVIVTGVASTATATADSAAPLRVLRADSTANTRHVVYQVSPGVEVTLVESPISVAERDLTADERMKDKAADSSALAGSLSGVTLRATAKTDRAAVAPSPRVMSAMAAPPPINTISWSDQNHRYTLSGPLKPNELEAIKARLMKTRR